MTALLILEQFREPEHSLFHALGLELGIHVHSADPASFMLDGSAPRLAGETLPAKFDGVVVRSYRRFAVVRQIARAFHLAGKRVMGLDPLHLSFTQDKLCDLMDLQAAGVPVPRTWTRAEDTPGSIVVSKENWGYGGTGVQLVDMAKASERGRPALDWVNHHFQEYLEAEEDWRVLVCEGKALPWVIVRRPAAGDFRTNTHQGGQVDVISAEHFPGSGALVAVAVEAARVLGRPCAGVDLRRGASGQPVVLEVNRTPRLRLGAHSEPVVRAYLSAWLAAVRQPQQLR
jgi:glutathione synthase/RimK-type ligase-like ATP-grasp enzyme